MKDQRQVRATRQSRLFFAGQQLVEDQTFSAESICMMFMQDHPDDKFRIPCVNSSIF